MKCPRCGSQLDVFKNKYVCSNDECDYSSKIGLFKTPDFISCRYEDKTVFDETVLEAEADALIKRIQRAKDYIKEGSTHIVSGEYERALELFDLAVREEPRLSASYYYKGLVYYTIGNYHNALDNLTEIDESNCSALMLKGAVYDSMDSFNEAIDCYKKAAGLDKDNHIACCNTAYTFFKLGQYDEALNWLNLALNIAPKNAVYFYNRGVVEKVLGRLEDAIKDFNSAIALNPKLFKAYEGKILSLYEMQCYEDALTQCIESMKFEYKNENLEDIKDHLVNILNNNVKSFTGHGKIYYDDGSLKYEGDIKEGTPCGLGKSYYKNGMPQYEGDFKDGIYEGSGILFNERGKFYYSGQFKNGVFDGRGRIYYEDGSTKYEGDFKNGSFDGEGRYYYLNGTIKYDGTFKNGKYDGQGSLCYPEGSFKYIGMFKDGKFNGTGQLYSPDGKLLYNGQFENNEFIG